MPNIERIKLWIDDLRTTQVPQVTGKLESLNGANCCLGRACRVAMQHGLELEVEQISLYDETTFNSAISFLPVEVMNWFDLETTDPILKTGEVEPQSASQLNDDKKYTFKQIADAIERTYLTKK